MEIWLVILLWIFAAFIFGVIIGKILKMLDNPPKLEERKKVNRL